MSEKHKQSEAGAEAMSFWERLQMAARQRGMPANPAYVAKLLGLNPSAVTKYKHGSFPHRRNLNTLAKHYDISADWLGSGLGAMTIDHNRGAEELDEQAREMLSLWAALPDNARARTLENIRYEARVAETETTGVRQALTAEFRDKINELIELAGKLKQ